MAPSGIVCLGLNQIARGDRASAQAIADTLRRLDPGLADQLQAQINAK